MKRMALTFSGLLLISYLIGGAALAQNWYRVKWVNDGDTIVLMNGKSVRYIGINATEIDHDNKTAEPFGYAAKQLNLNLVKSNKIRLEFDVKHRDHYGRLLAYIFLENGIFVNSRLLEDGLAFFYFKKPNHKYDRLFLRAQRKAMRAGKGMWQNWNEKKGSYTANKKSKRFHLSTCDSGRKIHPKNKIYFSRRWDAFQQGYAPAGRCQPVFELPSH